jgi:hypothetical protein
MSRDDGRRNDVRVEAVTATFVASGRPEGVHDLGRLLEALNHPVLTRALELKSASIRPLYRANARVDLDAPLLLRRPDIIFLNFEGPHFTRGMTKPATVDAPALLMAPPFQVQGNVAVDVDADATQGLRARASGFFVVRGARVYDADGALLGEGEQIIVNGTAVQMMSATRRHISVPNASPGREPAATTEVDAETSADERGRRAA